MNRPTKFRSETGCLIALMLSVGLAACGAQDGDAAFSEIALPTFSKDRVAQEAPVEVRRVFSSAAGLDIESFEATEATWAPRSFADARQAWQRQPDDPAEPETRVEAAS